VAFLFLFSVAMKWRCIFTSGDSLNRFLLSFLAKMQKNLFDGKHLNRGGAACYIAKYIAKNIDSYVLEGEMAVNTQNATR